MAHGKISAPNTRFSPEFTGVVLASQLPENIADARPMLQAVKELLDGFLAEADLTKKVAPVVSLIGGNECA